MISVDGKKVQTNVYDLKGELGKVTPYGVYDMDANTGWVSVGSDHDTGAFAVESIRRPQPAPRACSAR